MVKEDRVGVVALGRTVAAALVRDGAVTWTGSSVVGDDESLASVLGVVLGAAPRSRRRQSLILGLGRPHARARALHGVPTDASAVDVKRLVESVPEEFFLGDPSQWLTCPPEHVAGAWHAAVLDRALVETLIEVTASTDRRFRGAHPVAETSEEQEPDALTALAAAIAAGDKPRHLVDPELTRRSARNAGIRLVTFAIVLALAAGAASIAPALGLRWYTAGSERSLAQLRDAIGRLESVSGTGGLPLQLTARAAQADADSRAILESLSHLARALPDSGAFVSLRLDTLGGAAVLLSPPSQSGLRALLSADSVPAMRMAGALTSEEVLGVPVQRANVVWRRASARARAPTGSDR